MRSSGQSRLAKMLAGVLFAGMAATWAVGEVLDTHEMARRDEHEVARMTQKMKPVCVGRFLIDMPEEAQVEVGQVRIHGFNIAAYGESPEEFQKRLSDRETQIKAKPDRLGGNKNLESSTEVNTDSGVVGKIFVHSRTVTEGTAANGLELEHYRYEGVAVEALVHGAGISIDLVADDYHPDRIDNLSRLVAQLVPSPENKIPAESGFCIDRAYFREPLTADQAEQITLFAGLPSHPDVDFVLILAAGLKPDEQGLLERAGATEERFSLAERMRMSKLRAAPREISGLPGEELVELFVEENDARVHNFWWEVNGTEDNVLIPHFVFQMNTGKSNSGPVPSSLSDGVALGLWDKITSSIRLHAATPRVVSPVHQVSIPIGTYAAAGEQCPESGWWLCSDGGNGIGVLGGQRQYIKKGELMPQALLLPPPTLWEKMRGLQPSYESKNRTFWKLVDHRARKRLPPSLPLAKASMPTGATVAVGVPAEANANRAGIGTFSSTGVPCPASGWWRCEESHALDGTRWFAQGRLLPPATFTVAPGIFGHSSNAPQAIQRRSAWRLMRLADAPDYADRDQSVIRDLPPSTEQA